MTLLNKKCIPCEKNKGIKPFDKQKAEEYLFEIYNWVLGKNAKTISKEFKFKDFIGAINFINNVADIAEMEGHHPDIHINYNKVLLELTTHSIGGLSENDFIVAAKIDGQCVF
ncbi:4a-hydroxytetrahydrobiopterin dehydratase [Candidatus Nomurabacteria bacterium]|nr:4a-hydroxytetrahydrobiopterin dehydratase [Candidatus Nomurabacteria bacterium]